MISELLLSDSAIMQLKLCQRSPNLSLHQVVAKLHESEQQNKAKVRHSEIVICLQAHSPNLLHRFCASDQSRVLARPEQVSARDYPAKCTEVAWSS